MNGGIYLVKSIKTKFISKISEKTLIHLSKVHVFKILIRLHFQSTCMDPKHFTNHAPTYSCTETFFTRLFVVVFPDIFMKANFYFDTVI